MNRRPHAWLSLLGLALAIAASGERLSAQAIPTPESVLGRKPGADFFLATYDEALDYFRKLDAATDRVQLVPVGKTSMGLDWHIAIVSSGDNLRSLALDKARFRATVSVALLGLSVLRASGYAGLGLYDERVLWLLAAAVAVVALAMFAGDRWHARLDEARFGHVVAALLALSGAALLFK